MNSIERAWRAFLSAIEEAKTLTTAGADAATLGDLLQHARELLEIIDEEITLNGIAVTTDIRHGLDQLRAQLAAAEASIVTRH